VEDDDDDFSQGTLQEPRPISLEEELASLFRTQVETKTSENLRKRDMKANEKKPFQRRLPQEIMAIGDIKFQLGCKKLFPRVFKLKIKNKPF
jgi:hypothetical protein